MQLLAESGSLQPLESSCSVDDAQENHGHD